MPNNLVKLLLFCVSLTLAPLLPLSKATAVSAETSIVVLISPQAFVVERLVGSLAKVSVLLPAGGNLEHFSPSARHLRSLETAQLYVRLGHPAITIEPALIDKILTDTNIPVVTMSSEVALRKDDPHYWLSLKNIPLMAKSILPKLIELFPEHEQILLANATALSQDCDRLNNTFAQKFSTAKQKTFLVFHPAWDYFASDYGLTQLAIEREGKEPGPGRLTEIIELARAAGLSCIFTSPAHSSASVNAIAEILPGKVIMLDPLEQNIFQSLEATSQKIIQLSTNDACS